MFLSELNFVFDVAYNLKHSEKKETNHVMCLEQVSKHHLNITWKSGNHLIICIV